jgi:hypothetical protein
MDGLFHWEIESGVATLFCNGVKVAKIGKNKQWNAYYLEEISGKHPTMYSAMIAVERKFHIASELARA